LLLALGFFAPGEAAARIHLDARPNHSAEEKLAPGFFDSELAFSRLAAALQAAELQQAKSADGYDLTPGCSLAAKRIPGVCFVAGTAIATATGAQLIQALQVGDRVLTNDQNAENTEVDPATWRKITLRMPNPEHSSDIIDLQLLRSEEWMQEVSCSEGARIWFNLDEMGLHGWADVVAVEPCPLIQSGPGRVVLATVTHFNSFVIEVRLAGVAEVLQPTDRHRLFSVTRNDWVPAAQLTIGEELATKAGIIRVEAITPKLGTHRVYNIEVETEHCFYAGAAQVLSHNSNPCAMPADFASKRTLQRGAQFGTEGEARALARTKLGKDTVEVAPGKWRSADGKWQYRAKPGDVSENHVHLERLNPETGEVIENWHLNFPASGKR